MPQVSVRLTVQLHNQIESLVKKGLFINRSEFVRDSIRKQLSEIETKKMSNSLTEKEAQFDHI